MELRQLRTFLAVLEEGSVSGGARRLFLSQPAVTRQLQALERSLGGPLLERRAAGVVPTPAGEVLAREAGRLLEAADRLGAQVAGAARGSRPRLRLGVFLGRVAAAELTDPIVAAFRSRHPEALLEIRTLPLTDPWGRRHDLDVLLSKGAGAEGDDVTVLFEEPHVAGVPASHRLAGAATGPCAGLTAADLSAETIQDASALYRPADHAFSESCDLRHVPALAGVRRFPLGPGMRYDQILAAAAAGVFVNITVGSVARLTPAQGITAVPVHDVPPATTCVAVRRPGPLAEAFRRTAVDIARDLLPLVPEARAPGSPGPDGGSAVRPRPPRQRRPAGAGRAP